MVKKIINILLSTAITTTIIACFLPETAATYAVWYTITASLAATFLKKAYGIGVRPPIKEGLSTVDFYKIFPLIFSFFIFFICLRAYANKRYALLCITYTSFFFISFYFVRPTKVIYLLF